MTSQMLRELPNETLPQGAKIGLPSCSVIFGSTLYNPGPGFVQLQLCRDKVLLCRDRMMEILKALAYLQIFGGKCSNCSDLFQRSQASIPMWEKSNE